MNWCAYRVSRDAKGIQCARDTRHIVFPSAYLYIIASFACQHSAQNSNNAWNWEWRKYARC